MTAILEQPVASGNMFPVLNPVYAYTECIKCWRIGRVEWLSGGTVRALHGNYMCVIQAPLALLPEGVTEAGRAICLLR